jgi:ComF family protein
MIFRDLLDIFIPFECLCCGKTFLGDDDGANISLSLCADCMILVPRVLRSKEGEDLITKRYILSGYDGPLGFVLRAAKYGNNLPLMYAIGEFLAQSNHNKVLYSEMYDGIVHVPTGVFRKLRRGFDQAEILAISLSQEIGIQRFSSLIRIDPKEQSKRIGEERLDRKLRFRSNEVRDRDKVLLVDDVRTSGNTLQQCAQELLCCGVKEVHSICLLSRQI